MQTILITGGSGYIGSHTLLELARTGQYKLVVFDNLKNGHIEAIEIVRKNTNADIELIPGDLLDKQAIMDVCAQHKPEAVIHFAALIEAGVSMEYPTRFYENNVTGSINLIQAMQVNGIRKLVFSSTAAVYGTPETTLVDETSIRRPENSYAWSKFTVENLLMALATEHTARSEQIDSVILRYFNAAGGNPEQLIGQDYPKPTHLITVAIEAAMGKREKLTIFGDDYPTPDGSCIRDYIHVEDLARAHTAALGYLEGFQGCDIINVGTGIGSTNLEVVKLLEKIHGQFNWEIGPRRPGDPSGYVANNAKAKAVLGWEAKYTLADTLEHSYKWQKRYPKGYASLTNNDN